MGKTKIQVVGEVLPEEEKKKKERREAKKAAKKAEAEAAAKAETDSTASETEVEKDSGKKVSKYAAKKGLGQKTESKRYKDSATQVDRGNTYPLDKALTILKKFTSTKFDETVELHVNTKEDKLSGKLNLPHGTGKKLSIKIADDTLLKEIEKGNIDFDILLATPDMMPKLAKVARVLGPRGLMPNPKNGTITQNPEEAVKKLEGGDINYRTEAKAPIIHLSIGKKSYDEKKLSENVKAAVKAIGTTKIKSATLTSSMNPGIRLDVSTC